MRKKLSSLQVHRLISKEKNFSNKRMNLNQRAMRFLGLRKTIKILKQSEKREKSIMQLLNYWFKNDKNLQKIEINLKGIRKL